MHPKAEVARELLAALGDLILAPPRYLGALLRRRTRRAEFGTLAFDPPPVAAAGGAPRAALHRVVISAGDASGDAHAARLLQELRARHPGLQATGFGGARLQEAGLEVWEPLGELNVMGFRDVAAQLPLFFRCVHRFAAELRAAPPDVVVLVDYPGLNRHLLRIAARAGVPAVDYIAPQLWAWAPWRVRDFKRATRLLTILPFEGDWYRRRGASAEYVGHPLGDGIEAANEAPPPAVLAEDAEWVGILPGSRRREIRENLPAMLRAAALLRARRAGARFVLPHLRASVWPLLDDILGRAEVEVVRAPGSFHGTLARCRAAWVASGTALLETAAHGVPPVLVYGMSSRLADWLAHHALPVPQVGSLNLLAGRELAPEHVGRRLDPAALAADLEARLAGPGRADFLAAQAELAPRFAVPGAAARAARAVESAAESVKRSSANA